MPLGVRVSQAGGHRLISVCSLFKLHWAAEEIRILSLYPSFSLSSLRLPLAHSACFSVSPSLTFSSSQPLFHTRSGVESLLPHTSRLFSPHLSSLCFSPPVPTPTPSSPFLGSLFHLLPLSLLLFLSLPNVSLLSLSCLLLTLFIAHTVSPSRSSSSLLFSHHSVFTLPLSFSIPGTTLSSHTFIPTFPVTSPAPPPPPPPLILHHFGIPRLSLLFHPSILPSFAHTSSLLLPSGFIFLSTDEWWEIWKCQRDRAGDQRGRC